MADERVRSLAEAEQHIQSLTARALESERRVRLLEEILDTRATPLWKRIIFRLDGWGPWWQVSEAPRWRPWRRWWTS